LAKKQLGLDDFGLSDYESRAYVALLEYGPMPVRDLAYRAGIPRTKAYSTVKKLIGKRMVELLSKNPVKVQAVPPEECLTHLLNKEREKLEGMKSVLDYLVKLRMSRLSAMEKAEHYFLKPGAMPGKLSELLASSEGSGRFILDSWGLEVLEKLDVDIDRALARGIDLKAVVGWEYGSDLMASKVLPKLDSRIVKGLGGNIFVFDQNEVMATSKNGSVILIRSPELGTALVNYFSMLWEEAMDYRHAISLMGLNVEEETLELLLNGKAKDYFIEAVIEEIRDGGLVSRIGERFIKKLEDRVGISLFGKPMEVALPVVTSLIKQGNGVRMRYDSLTKMLTVESDGYPKPSFIWLFALSGLLARNGSNLKLLQNVRAEGSHVLQAMITV